MANICGKFCNEANHKYILVVFAAIFFVVYSYPALVSPPKFVSPDETANYFFTELYSETGELAYSDELNEIAHGIIRPRGTVYSDGRIVPQKFLGFPVVNGTVAVLIPEFVRFLTPLLAVVGVLFLFLLLRDLFNERVAVTSSLLLFISSPYWYWSSMGMFENVAGCVMLIISLRYFFKLLTTNDLKDYLLTGLFLGLALFMRPEFILLAAPLFIIVLLNRKRIRKLYACLSLLSFIVAISPFFILNDSLYGSPLSTGHHLHYGVAEPISIGSFSMVNILKNSVNLVLLTPLLFLFSLFGLVSCSKKGVNLHYILFFIVASLTLCFYFLSGRVSSIDIHSSYVRYLLPLYLLSLPFVSHFILRFKSKIAILLVCSIVLVSVPWVVLKTDANLNSSARYDRISSEIVEATEPDAVIFLDYWDKAVFPERKVGLVRELPEESRCETLSEIVTKLSEMDIPIYALIEKRFLDFIDYDTFATELSARGYTLSETGREGLYGIETL